MREQYLCDLLVTAPHPDDAELFCGGLLIQSRMRGHRTVVIDVSDAELNTLGTPNIRLAETNVATEMLGLTFRESSALPNYWSHSCDDPIVYFCKTSVDQSCYFRADRNVFNCCNG